MGAEPGEVAAIVAAAGPHPGGGSEEDPAPGPEAPPPARPPRGPPLFVRPLCLARGRLRLCGALLVQSHRVWKAKKTPTRRGGDWLQVTRHSQDPVPEPGRHPSRPCDPQAAPRGPRSSPNAG